jgi:hypothetical protein
MFPWCPCIRPAGVITGPSFESAWAYAANAGRFYVFKHERGNTPEFEQYIESTRTPFKAAVEQLTTADQKMRAA